MRACYASDGFALCFFILLGSYCKLLSGVACLNTVCTTPIMNKNVYVLPYFQRGHSCSRTRWSIVAGEGFNEVFNRSTLFGFQKHSFSAKIIVLPPTKKRRYELMVRNFMRSFLANSSLRTLWLTKGPLLNMRPKPWKVLKEDTCAMLEASREMLTNEDIRANR